MGSGSPILAGWVPGSPIPGSPISGGLRKLCLGGRGRKRGEEGGRRERRGGQLFVACQENAAHYCIYKSDQCFLISET